VARPRTIAPLVAWYAFEEELLRSIRKFAGIVALMAMPLMVVPAQSAPTAGGEEVGARFAPCGTNGPLLDGHTVTGAAAGARIRTGSSTTCTARGSIQPSHSLTYYCYTGGDDQITWTYLRNNTTGVLGWVRDNLLPGGSIRPCGF